VWRRKPRGVGCPWASSARRNQVDDRIAAWPTRRHREWSRVVSRVVV